MAIVFVAIQVVLYIPCTPVRRLSVRVGSNALIPTMMHCSCIFSIHVLPLQLKYSSQQPLTIPIHRQSVKLQIPAGPVSIVTRFIIHEVVLVVLLLSWSLI